MYYRGMVFEALWLTGCNVLFSLNTHFKKIEDSHIFLHRSMIFLLANITYKWSMFLQNGFKMMCSETSVSHNDRVTDTWLVFLLQ